MPGQTYYYVIRDIFSLGFGPFRWVCTSGSSEDLEETDKIAKEVLEDLIKSDGSSLLQICDYKSLISYNSQTIVSLLVPTNVHQQYKDNMRWITQAGKHKLVFNMNNFVI